MESWKLAESIRAYLKHHKEYNDLDWANNYADSIDPTTESKTNIIDIIKNLNLGRSRYY